MDFYQKTFHSLDYYTAPRPDEKDAMGAHDNSWCSDPQAVIDFMAKVKKPWIAFKILAAGAIQPRAAFPYAFNNGADFILVGMFDWQIEEDAKLARRVVAAVPPRLEAHPPLVRLNASEWDYGPSPRRRGFGPAGGTEGTTDRTRKSRK